MAAKRKAIIIGGGPAGLTTALRLQQTSNVRCSVYEIRPEPTTLGGAIGILSNGLRLLHRLGVYEPLLTRGSSRSSLFVHSAQGQILGVQEDYVAYGRAQTGFGYMRIKRTDLMDVLLDEISEAKIPVHFDKHLTKIDESDKDGVTVTFSDGTKDRGDILLGCDGIHSSVRRLYVDPDQAPEYTGFSGTGAIVPTSRLPSATVDQLNGFDVTMTEEGMLMAMFCTAAGDEVLWGFSQEVALPESGDSRDGWDEHRKGVVDGFKSHFHQVLTNARGDWSDTLRQLIDNTDSINFYPIYRLPLGKAWFKGRCMLLGDAAHAMQPHAGQGVSMALEDAFLISRLLEQPNRPVSEVYEKFDQIRRPRVEELYHLAARNVGVRKKTGPWGLWAKEVGFRVALSASGILGLDKRGYGQKHLAYDIDAVEI